MTTFLYLFGVCISSKNWDKSSDGGHIHPWVRCCIYQEPCTTIQCMFDIPNCAVHIRSYIVVYTHTCVWMCPSVLVCLKLSLYTFIYLQKILLYLHDSWCSSHFNPGGRATFRAQQDGWGQFVYWKLLDGVFNSFGLFHIFPSWFWVYFTWRWMPPDWLEKCWLMSTILTIPDVSMAYHSYLVWLRSLLHYSSVMG